MLRVGFIAGCVAVFAVGADVRAEQLGVVTISPSDAPNPRVALERALRLASTGAGHQVLVDPAAAARARAQSGAVLADRLKPFARAESLLAEGWRHYATVEMELAQSRLLAARAAALEVSDLAGGVALVAETSLRLGVIEFELGLATSSANFRLSYRLAPSRAVTDDEFKPAVVTAFRAAIAEPTVKRPVAITAEPANASIEIDGTQRTASESVELEVGLHLVVVRAQGMVAAGNLETVENVGAAELGATLAPDPSMKGLFAGTVELGTPSPRAVSILESTLIYAEIDAVLIAASVWRGSETALLGQRCAGYPLRCTAVVDVALEGEGGLGLAASELVEILAKTPLENVGVLVPTTSAVLNSKAPPIVDTTPKPRPWYKNRWLWVGVGAVAVAAGTTAAILSIDKDEPLVITADPCDFGSCPR